MSLPDRLEGDRTPVHSSGVEPVSSGMNTSMEPTSLDAAISGGHGSGSGSGGFSNGDQSAADHINGHVDTPPSKREAMTASSSSSSSSSIYLPSAPTAPVTFDPSKWSSSHLEAQSTPRARATSPRPTLAVLPDPSDVGIEPNRPPSPGRLPPSSSAWSQFTSYATSNEYRDPQHSPGLRSAFSKIRNAFAGYGRESPPHSPYLDGKKEPSIRGGENGAADAGYPVAAESSLYHPQARVRSGAYPGHAYANFPMSQPNNLAYKDKDGGAAGPGEMAAAGLPRWTDSTAFWLAMYFALNLGLTLYNKIVLVSFPFPYTLTGLHALSGCIGCYVALERGAFIPAQLTPRDNLTLAAFSVLYTINIAVSNISLQLVTVPFHQVVRASTPLFTIIISAVLLRTRFSTNKLLTLLPVVAGVGFATYGDYYFTAWGLILTLLGTFLAALKTVVTNLIQTGSGSRLKLHPLDLLMRMSPMAFIQCVVYGWSTGELERVRRYGATQMTRSKALALLLNGVIACGLNIVSFTANKKAGALTMTVSANCKQVLTIALAVFLFDLHITFTNGIGILLTLVGGAWYGWAEYQDKKKRAVKNVR